MDSGDLILHQQCYFETLYKFRPRCRLITNFDLSLSQAALQSSSSPLVLPALSWLGASAVPGLLQEKLGVSPLSVDPDTLEHLRLNASDNTLLLIILPYSTG